MALDVYAVRDLNVKTREIPMKVTHAKITFDNKLHICMFVDIHVLTITQVTAQRNTLVKIKRQTMKRHTTKNPVNKKWHLNKPNFNFYFIYFLQNHHLQVQMR